MPSITRTIGSLALVCTLLFAGAGCGSSGSKASFCDKAKAADKSNVDPSDGKAFAALLTDLQASAPSEIKGDLKTLNDFVANSQKNAGQAPTKAEQEKAQKASEDIQTYLKDECGIETSS